MQVITETFLVQSYQVHVGDVERETTKQESTTKQYFLNSAKKFSFRTWECVCQITV